MALINASIILKLKPWIVSFIYWIDKNNWRSSTCRVNNFTKFPLTKCYLSELGVACHGGYLLGIAIRHFLWQDFFRTGYWRQIYSSSCEKCAKKLGKYDKLCQKIEIVWESMLKLIKLVAVCTKLGKCASNWESV